MSVDVHPCAVTVGTARTLSKSQLLLRCSALEEFSCWLANNNQRSDHKPEINCGKFGPSQTQQLRVGFKQGRPTTLAISFFKD
jgi:hypothetical protein